MNTFTQVPKKGDIWLREVATKKDTFIVLDTYDGPSLNQDKYEVLGSVAHVDRNGILVVYKTNTNQVFFNRAWWYLDGYTLDGTERTGVLSIRTSTDSWAANKDKTITYTATTMEELVSALNAAFAADADFVADDWEASVINGRIRLTANASWQSFAYTSAKSGFTFPGGHAPEFKAVSIRRKNGSTGGISNIERAAAYYRADNVGYKPTAPVTTIKMSEIVCLPVYLGTSAVVVGDMCAYLRGVFGEGEEGWRNYLRCMEPVIDTQIGGFYDETGKRLSDLIGSMRYTSPKVTDGVFSPAIEYARNISTRTISKGELHMASMKEGKFVLRDIKHGTSSSRQADVINDSLYRIGGSAIKNTSSWWVLSRSGSHYAWFSYGAYGVFSYGGFSASYGVFPVLRLKITQ